MRRRLSFLGMCFLIGCTASTGAPSTDCAMSMPVSGVITTTLTGAGCGSSTGGDTMLNFMSGDFLGGGEITTANIDLGSALAGGQTGTFASSDVEITESGADAGDVSWQTPASACTVTITSNVSSPDPSGVFKNRYVIDGNGTCSQPAVAPATQTQGGSISISPFTFHGFIDPAS